MEAARLNLGVTRTIQSAQQHFNSLRASSIVVREGNETVTATADEEETLNSQDEEAAPVNQDAIVYLTGKDIYRPGRKHCPSLLHSLGSLARHFPVQVCFINLYTLEESKTEPLGLWKGINYGNAYLKSCFLVI